MIKIEIGNYTALPVKDVNNSLGFWQLHTMSRGIWKHAICNFCWLYPQVIVSNERIR